MGALSHSGSTAVPSPMKSHTQAKASFSSVRVVAVCGLLVSPSCHGCTLRLPRGKVKYSVKLSWPRHPLLAPLNVRALFVPAVRESRQKLTVALSSLRFRSKCLPQCRRLSQCGWSAKFLDVLVPQVAVWDLSTASYRVAVAMALDESRKWARRSWSRLHLLLRLRWSYPLPLASLEHVPKLLLHAEHL